MVLRSLLLQYLYIFSVSDYTVICFPTVREIARVMFPYNAEHEDELELQEGDIITVLCKELEDKGWWRGELNSRVGVFPDNFVELITVEETVSG